MKRSVWLYGLGLAITAILLQVVEYRYTLRDLSTGSLVFIIAVIFMGLGAWVVWQFTRYQASSSSNAVPSPRQQPLAKRLAEIGISEREQEVLQLMAQGFSNQEIADQLFISLNTVKTHISKLYAKLDVRRRTQAVQRATELGLLKV